VVLLLVALLAAAAAEGSLAGAALRDAAMRSGGIPQAGPMRDLPARAAAGFETTCLSGEWLEDGDLGLAPATSLPAGMPAPAAPPRARCSPSRPGGPQPSLRL
jgi:hypothetical protein